MKEKNPFNLDVVSVRLVKDAPIMSGHPITNPEDAVLLLGKHLCEMDREVLFAVVTCFLVSKIGKRADEKQKFCLVSQMNLVPLVLSS